MGHKHEAATYGEWPLLLHSFLAPEAQRLPLREKGKLDQA